MTCPKNADPKEYERLRARARRAKDGAKINEWARARHAYRMASDPEYRKRKAVNSTKWQRANLPKALAAVVRRDAGKMQATPSWADQDHIRGMYELAGMFKGAGIRYEVDHIIPLRSPSVCGLHVQDNLRLIDPVANKSKGNRHWPDQP